MYGNKDIHWLVTKDTDIGSMMYAATASPDWPHLVEHENTNSHPVCEQLNRDDLSSIQMA